MNFILKPTLMHIAFVKVAASLWNHHDVRLLIKEIPKSQSFSEVGFQYFFDEIQPQWLKIEEKVLEKVSQLTIPNSLKEKLLGYIRPIGLQILRWLEYHCKYYNFSLNLPNQFCWTPQGTVDKQKTVKKLVKDHSIDITTRYKLACVYCLENDVTELWNRLPESTQKTLLYEDITEEYTQRKLQFFWWMYLNREMAELRRIIRQKLNRKCSTYRYMFRSTAANGNKSATEYFLQKIFPREKSLFNTALYIAKARLEISIDIDINVPPKEYYSEVLCFLLSRMSEDQQVKVFKRIHFLVLDCLLDWPYQSFFTETASRMWDFCGESSCFKILKAVILKVKAGYKDYDYGNMFREVWQQMPLSYKRYIIENSISDLLLLLLEIKDRESIQLIVQSATPTEKKELIFSCKGHSLLENIVIRDEWSLLKFFIHVFISSKDEMIKFKQKYEESMNRISLSKYMIDKMPEFVKFLDDFIHGYDKRKNTDEDNCSPPKRLCNIELKDMT